jgi:1-phosphatidylinositol-3-phosphate 5-kinase
MDPLRRKSSLDSITSLKGDEEPSSSDHGSGTSVPAKSPSRWARFSFTGLSGPEHRRRISLRKITSTTPTLSPTSPLQPAPAPISQSSPQESPFNTALNLLNASKSLLSTSIGVTFLPPSLLIDLARKERDNPNRRLKGDEKAALASILGWTGTGSGYTGGIGGALGKDDADGIRDGPGKGMTGLTGFLRQQGLQVLVSRHVLSKRKESTALHPPTRPGSALSMTSTTSISATGVTPKPSTVFNNTPHVVFRDSSTSSAEITDIVCCGRPRWHTYRYFSFSPSSTSPLSRIPPQTPPISTASPKMPPFFSRNSTVSVTTNLTSEEGGQDKRLGEVILEIIRDANSPCTASTSTTAGGGYCGYKNGEHELRIVHAGVRISVNVCEYEDFGHEEKDKELKREKAECRHDAESEDQIKMWLSCRICQKRTARIDMSDGTLYVAFLSLSPQ